ncbi:unnamed protein product [Rotaria sordida]|uniref:Endonuclease/exonuclease/phosphatase domain-containing protein n=1 Tax=Rotaria sordida TaxID=392033 RepID=A0A819TWT9_9BILA|nr:unnamed protein product [Rotaria sordida]
MISIRLQGKPTNLTIIQIYAPTTEAEESTIDDFYMDLQQILDDVPKKDAILIIGDWNAKVGETAVPGIVGKFGLGKRNEAEHIMRKAEIDEAAGGIKIGGRNINNLRYADDTTILAETADDLQCLLRKVDSNIKMRIDSNLTIISWLEFKQN